VVQEVNTGELTTGEMDAVEVEEKLQRGEPACSASSRLRTMGEWAVMGGPTWVYLHIWSFINIFDFWVQTAGLEWWAWFPVRRC
jgi:hypothetical protein